MQDKGQILAEIKGLKDLFNEKFESNDKAHDSILAQTTKTNGRVTALEAWKNQFIGAGKLITVLGVANILTLIVFWIKTMFNN